MSSLEIVDAARSLRAAHCDPGCDRGQDQAEDHEDPEPEPALEARSLVVSLPPNTRKALPAGHLPRSRALGRGVRAARGGDTSTVAEPVLISNGLQRFDRGRKELP